MRRSIRWLFFAASSLFFGWTAISRAADDSQAILDRAIQAHGGAKRLADIKAEKIKSRGNSSRMASIEMDGKKETDTDFVREVWFAPPDRFKVDTVAKVPIMMGAQINTRTVTLFDRGKGKSLELGGIIAQKPEEISLDGPSLSDLKEKVHRQNVKRLIGLKDPAYQLSSLGEAKVEGKPATGLRVKAKGYQDVDLFFDKDTGLLVKTRYQTHIEERVPKDPKNPGKGIKLVVKNVVEEEIVTAHQKLDGVVVPQKIVVHVDGEEVEEEEFIEVHLLKAVDEHEFVMPKPAARVPGGIAGQGRPPNANMNLKELNTIQLVKALGGQASRLKATDKFITAVDLRNTKITDRELKELLKQLKSLKKLRELQYFSLVNCAQISDEALKELSKEFEELKDLQTLFIGGTKVTDQGVKELKRLKGLRQLGLSGTQLTDAGLKELKDLQDLQRLFLAKTQVTDSGIDELKKNLPNIQIRRWLVKSVGWIQGCTSSTDALF